MGCVFACCLISNLNAQTPPKLKIAKDSPTSVQINWTNVVGTSYRVLFTSNLTNHLSLWTPLEDAFSDDTNISVGASTTDTPIGFFIVKIPTNGTLPAVQIFSPTNSQTVSGEIGVGVGAQITNQLEGANLYLDDALVGFIDSGGIKFNLDTTHFANGSHTLYAGAVDTANNETLSSSITLDFENPVRWLDASSMFNSFVPIDVDSDIFPADWLVSVTDTNGTIVRTITGSTTDGSIQTSWDGTDDNGQPLPVENLYQITVDVTASGGSSPMMASSLASTLGATSVSSALNPHGVPEFTVQKPAPNPLTAYLNMLAIYQQLTPQEKFIYPPLPDRPASNPYATTTIKMSARDMFLAFHHVSSATVGMAAGTATPNAGSSLASGFTKDLVWYENSWTSKQTIVARVPISGGLNNNVINLCNQIAIFIGTADGTVGNNRGVYGGGGVTVITTSSDVYNLTNMFADQNATAFYFYGHGSATGNSIGTQSAVIGAKNVGTQLGNLYLPSSPRFSGRLAMVTHKPFNFVFLDGCNTGLGDFPEAFGIPKAVKAIEYDSPHSELHKRAFIGWSGPVTFQFDPAHINWSLKFWSTWLDDTQGYDITVTTARNAAYADQPSVNSNVPDRQYGSQTLTWSN